MDAIFKTYSTALEFGPTLGSALVEEEVNASKYTTQCSRCILAALAWYWY